MPGSPPVIRLLPFLLCVYAIATTMPVASATSMNNDAPVVETPIGNILATETDENMAIDLTRVFSAPVSGDTLHYALVTNAFPGVAEAEIEQDTLVIRFLKPGQTHIGISASTGEEAVYLYFAVGVVPEIEGSYIVADFSDLELPAESFWNGADGSGGFVSGNVFFPNQYNPDWGAWSGWSYSNSTDNTTPGWMNQYSAITGTGIPGNGDDNPIYGVAYNPASLSFKDSAAFRVKGFYVTNNTYAGLSMKYGDDFSKKFGGEDGTDPDWFRLSVWGMAGGEATDTIGFYLADYRFDDNTKNHIVETWQWLGLSSLGKVDSLMFGLASSDMGDWGMNTPAYFCIDNMLVYPDKPPYVSNPVRDVHSTTAFSKVPVDLSEVFSDPDDDDCKILVMVKDNTNAGLVTTEIDEKELILHFTEGATGEAKITLEAVSNSKSVTTSFTVTVREKGPHYIYEVIEYMPAPGQFINTKPWGHPSSANSITGCINGSLSLGAFGGYVIFRFEHPVINHPGNPYGVDFIVFGNPTSQWAEPGIVSVMKDENGNGLPDGTWYELAGSDHFFSSTIHNDTITYHNPKQDGAADVRWTDNGGQSGYVLANPYHEHSYYPDASLFPSVNLEKYSLPGTRIKGYVDASDPANIISRRRAFGYADNQVRGAQPHYIPGNPYAPDAENAGGDGFDISWAVDSSGNYVDLDKIHFIKVHTAILANGGWLGEVSTEITGAVMVEPGSSPVSITDMVVIRDLPGEINQSPYPLEAFAYRNGRLLREKNIVWETNADGAYVDDDHWLHFHEPGEITLHARWEENPDITASVRTTVDPAGEPTGKKLFDAGDERSLFPNPATGYITIKGADHARVEIVHPSGAVIKVVNDLQPGMPINIAGLTAGIYFVRIHADKGFTTLKMIKQ